MKIKSLLLLPIASLLLSGCSLEDFIKIGNANSQQQTPQDNTAKDEEEKPATEQEEQKPSQEEEEKPSQEEEQKPSEETHEEEKPSEEEEATTYKVKLNPGRGTGTEQVVEVDKGFSYILPKCSFTAPLGEAFVCWLDNDNLAWKSGKEVVINEDTTFTAYYASSGVKVYTVSFDSNGGTGSMEPIEIEEGLYELPACKFSAPSGKVFDYWSIPNASTKYQPGNSINVTGDVTVSANWKNAVTQAYSITYDSNGGSGSMAKTTGQENNWVYLAYCTFTAPSGKEFDYWNVDGSARAEHQAIQLTKDFTARAIWKAKVQEEEDDDYDLVNLDCGNTNAGIPDNKNNPVELKTTLSEDQNSWYNTSFDEYGMGDYRYIYGNNVTCAQTYATGYLKITKKGQGFGSPYFNHSGAKLELRIGIGETNNASGKPSDKKKDVFRIYFFGETNNLLGQINIAGDAFNQNSKEIKQYYQASNASQVKYFEFRCNEQPHNSSGNYINVGISYCNIKSWERAS